MPDRRITIADVSRVVGVSHQAVSKVLNQGRSNIRVGIQTAERIRRAAVQLGYRPNASAQAFRSGRFAAAGLLLPAEGRAAYVPAGFVRVLAGALGRRDLLLTVAELPDQVLTDEGHVPRILRELSADGLLINYISAIPQRMVDLIRAHAIPSIWLNTRQTHDCVHPDDEAAGRQATRRLLEAGHRRIGYLRFGPRAPEAPCHYSAADRLAGYRRAMADAGLDPRPEEHPHLSFSERPAGDGDDRLAVLCALLRREDRPTGLVAYSEREALPALAAALQLGLRLPQDLSIVSIHNGGMIDSLGIPVTTLQLPMPPFCEAAVDMLLQKIDQPRQLLPARAVGFVWREGDTLGPPALGGRSRGP